MTSSSSPLPPLPADALHNQWPTLLATPERYSGNEDHFGALGADPTSDGHVSNSNGNSPHNASGGGGGGGLGAGGSGGAATGAEQNYYYRDRHLTFSGADHDDGMEPFTTPPFAAFNSSVSQPYSTQHAATGSLSGPFTSPGPRDSARAPPALQSLTTIADSGVPTVPRK